ncbi:U11/U12 small nuclear ribonucleoprotein 48 kDa protein [Rhagoletis pomonella]|uniref:U11/U12 small nuclear ribonucleoprotein 48 kDa protein n=1 Tax=Rhagoletis pomonella TaxID=28610 RepID=UPI00177AB379|nr:U11/U12 small nuclear ribonucleoprotein 48 kDa protein [Rhagoletis pomonella]XP_036338885.1 U11/U12 small nuclear ribonucleoprotein 48 kDa protein [Rhagoletis pomonella]
MADNSKDTCLNAFIVQSKARLRKILERLEWSVCRKFFLQIIVQGTDSEDATQNDVHVDFDSEPEFPPSYATGNFIKTDVAELRKIVNDESIEVPRRFSDLQLNFKRQQKLAIYEHVVANTEKCSELALNVPALNEGSLTFAEIVAQKKRETKKRRRYRKSKPTHIEEVRAVLDLQMQALQQYLKTKSGEERRIKPEMYKGHKRRSIEKYERLSKRAIREPEKHYNYHKSRSRSADPKSSKKSRHKSRSPIRSHKNEKHARDRSSRTKRKKHKHRSRSHSKRKSLKGTIRNRSIEKKSHKRRSRSYRRGHHRREDYPESPKVGL